jgi:hypothetical protein
MHRTTLRLLWWWIRAIWWLVCAPFMLSRRLYRWTGRFLGVWILITHDTLPCPGCGQPISLLGRWQCGSCHYVFDGFAFAPCEVCGATPPFLACQACGVGVKNPLRFP